MAYIESFNGKRPKIHETAVIAPTAVLIGDITIDEGVSIWPNVVIRGDISSIHIGAYTPLEIEPYVLIGHNAMVHGRRIGRCTLIGMCVCAMGWTDIGSGCIVGAGTLITQGKTVPDRSLVYGNPARIVRTLEDAAVEETKKAVMEYHALSSQYTDWQA